MAWDDLIHGHPMELSFHKEFVNEAVCFDIDLEDWSGFFFRGSALTANANQLKMLVDGDTDDSHYRNHNHVARHVLQTSNDVLYGSHGLVAPALLGSGPLSYFHVEGSYYSYAGQFMFRLNQRAEETNPVSSTIYTANGSNIYLGTGDKNKISVTSGGLPVTGLVKIFKFY